MALFASHRETTIALVFLLGLAGFLLNPAVWVRVYTLAPDAPMLAGATNSSAFQAGLTLAPLLAGLPLSLGHGLPSVGWIGVALGVAALGLAVLDRRLSGQELATSRDRSVRVAERRVASGNRSRHATGRETSATCLIRFSALFHRN